MVTVDLTPGQHTITMSLVNHNILEAVINISITGAVTCISVVGGLCNSAVSPGVIISSTTIIGYLKAGIVDLSEWVLSKGGSSEFYGNLALLGNIIDGYITPLSLGFEVGLADIGVIINYYLGSD